MRVADDVAVVDGGRVVLARAASDVDDLELLRDAYFGRVDTGGR
jgi:branched-chain amino acid transport system ATP-binding protein